MERKYYIAWNEERTEGFITNEEQDAIEAISGEWGQVRSAMGLDFFECYCDQECSFEEVTLSPTPTDKEGVA